MGWLVFILSIIYLMYRAFCSSSKPQSVSSLVPTFPSPRKYQRSRANFEQEVNAFISGMRCYRCNTGESPTYEKQDDGETINCCCELFLKDIMTRIEDHFNTDQVSCVMTYNQTADNSIAPLVKKTDRSQSAKKMPHGEPEILIIYVDAEGSETTRMISDLRYSKSYYFKAYCHLREDERHFCPERIKQAIDLKTGEVLDMISVKWGDKGKTRKFKGIGWGQG